MKLRSGAVIMENLNVNSDTQEIMNESISDAVNPGTIAETQRVASVGLTSEAGYSSQSTICIGETETENFPDVPDKSASAQSNARNIHATENTAPAPIESTLQLTDIMAFLVKSQEKIVSQFQISQEDMKSQFQTSQDDMKAHLSGKIDALDRHQDRLLHVIEDRLSISPRKTEKSNDSGEANVKPDVAILSEVKNDLQTQEVDRTLSEDNLSVIRGQTTIESECDHCDQSEEVSQLVEFQIASESVDKVSTQRLVKEIFSLKAKISELNNLSCITGTVSVVKRQQSVKRKTFFGHESKDHQYMSFIKARRVSVNVSMFSENRDYSKNSQAISIAWDFSICDLTRSATQVFSSFRAEKYYLQMQRLKYFAVDSFQKLNCDSSLSTVNLQAYQIGAMNNSLNSRSGRSLLSAVPISKRLRRNTMEFPRIPLGSRTKGLCSVATACESFHVLQNSVEYGKAVYSGNRIGFQKKIHGRIKSH